MNEKFEIDAKIVQNLEKKIIIKESRNIKNKKLNDQEMVKYIMKEIEGAVDLNVTQNNQNL